MAEWRLARGWKEGELEARLARVDRRRLNFVGADGELTPERGWNHVRSHAVVAREITGLPTRGGPFERARELVARFEFSDPRVVVGHFDPESPLQGRVLLLELKAARLHFLAPVRIGATLEESASNETRFGYCFETLDGHIERGREWFLLTKDHRTGAVRFKIEADWGPGQFPGWWARLGFALLGRRYQRAWHRLAHVRLRRLIAAGAPAHDAPPHALVHEGCPLHLEPVQFFALRASGAYRTRVERESEERPKAGVATRAFWPD